MDNEKKLQKVLDYLEKKNIWSEYGKASPYDFDKSRVLAINWNGHEKLYDFIENLDLDIVLEWSDAVTSCCECSKYVSTTLGYYGDQLNFINTEYGPVCRECLENNPDYLIEELVNDDDRACPDWGIDILRKSGFICLDDIQNENSCKIFENGFYPGQNDTPQNILKALRDELGFNIRDKYDTIWFLNSVGQFDIHFSLMCKEL